MKAYAYVSKELYNDVMEKGRVYPISGHSCFATFNGLYKAYERRYGQQPFFAWSKPTTDFKDDETGDWVYIELELPDEITKTTNYLNWSDLILIYENDDTDPSDELLQERLDFYGFDMTDITLENFWEDIYAIDENDRNQILYNYLDKSFIKRKAVKKNYLKTY